MSMRRRRLSGRCFWPSEKPPSYSISAPPATAATGPARRRRNYAALASWLSRCCPRAWIFRTRSPPGLASPNMPPAARPPRKSRSCGTGAASSLAEAKSNLSPSDVGRLPRKRACVLKADAWRGEYQGAMEEVRAGRIGFSKLDILHRRNLERALERFGVSNLSEEQRRTLNLAWHRLDAWPDVPTGLARLKRGYVIAPVSNGNISLMVDLARRNGFPWDAILGA